MPSVVHILNWFAKNKRFYRELQDILTGKGNKCTFITMRFGMKWADALKPKDFVNISIGDDTKNPNIIGFAKVRAVKKTTVGNLEDRDLALNIGAKTCKQVAKDMQLVYKRKVSLSSIVSVIELSVEN